MPIDFHLPGGLSYEELGIIQAGLNRGIDDAQKQGMNLDGLKLEVAIDPNRQKIKPFPMPSRPN